MKTLREYVTEAREKKIAIGHFNISNLESLHGIFAAAKSLNVPVIIGVSEGERDFVGVHEAVALVKSLRESNYLGLPQMSAVRGGQEKGEEPTSLVGDENFLKSNEEMHHMGEPYPIFLNADHTYSFEKVKEAIDAGFDSVIFDGAKLSFEENVKMTKQCVEYAKSCGRDVLVEGELGFIGTSSKVFDTIPDGVLLDEQSLTDPLKAKEFVQATGVDMLAPAVGNFHGMLRGGVDPKLHIGRIKEITEAVGVPLVLHGGSGNSEDDFKQAIASGVVIVHINTEIRVAYKQGLMKGLSENPDEVAPYKYLRPAVQAVQDVVEKKLKEFNNL